MTLHSESIPSIFVIWNLWDENRGVFKLNNAGHVWFCKSDTSLEFPLLPLCRFFLLCATPGFTGGLLRLPGSLYWHRKSIRLTFRLMSSASARLLPVTHSALVWTGGCGFPFTTGPQPWCLQVCTPVTLHAFEPASELKWSSYSKQQSPFWSHSLCYYLAGGVASW